MILRRTLLSFQINIGSTAGRQRACRKFHHNFSGKRVSCGTHFLASMHKMQKKVICIIHSLHASSGCHRLPRNSTVQAGKLLPLFLLQWSIDIRDFACNSLTSKKFVFTAFEALGASGLSASAVSPSSRLVCQP